MDKLVLIHHSSGNALGTRVKTWDEAVEFINDALLEDATSVKGFEVTLDDGKPARLGS